MSVSTEQFDPDFDFWTDSSSEGEVEMPPIEWYEQPEFEEEPLHNFRRAKRGWSVTNSTTSSSTDPVGVPQDPTFLNVSTSQDRPWSKLSLFSSATDANPLKEITLVELVEMVRNPPRFLSIPFKQCQEVLARENEEAYREAKKRLPGVTLSGSFQKRGNAYLKEHSGLMVIDLDHINGERLQAAKEQLQADPHCVLLYISPSGEGLKGALLLKDAPHDDPEHKRAFFGVKNYIEKKYGLVLDPPCKDVSRLSFLSIDPACFYNPDATPLVLDGWIADKGQASTEKRSSKRSGTNSSIANGDLVSSEKVEATLFKIPPRPDYDIWLRIAAAVRNALGDNDKAIEMLKRWSPEEKEGEYQHLLRDDFSAIGFGTLAFHANEGEEAALPADDSGDANELLFTDLSDYLDGSAQQEVPTVGQAWADHYLFYRGRLNEVHAEPGLGKTNNLMATCISVLEEGGSVLYIDPEDTPQGFATRMLMLGADAEAIRDRVFYLHNPEPKQILAAQSWARENQPDIVILDGLAESMAAVGADENSAGEVLRFFRDTLRPFAESGAAVVVADHVTKNSDNRGQYARGSGAKAGRYDGVCYEILAGKPYTPTEAGFVKLKITKDRNGGAGPRGKIVAELHFTPGEDGPTITEFRGADQTDGEFKPTVYMDRILEHLQLNTSATSSELRQLGKSQFVMKAMNQLIKDGRISFEQIGQSKRFYLINRFQACSPVPTVFPPCSEQGDQPCSPVPPPKGGTGRTGSNDPFLSSLSATPFSTEELRKLLSQ